MTQATVEMLYYARQQLLEAIEGLNADQLNKTPAGFNNNIIWNVAHVIAVQEAYLYNKNGLSSSTDAQLVSDYANGTFPKDYIDQNEIDAIKELAISSVKDLETDIKSGLFNSYQPSTITPNKINLATFDDTLSFILFHEALHVGAVRSLKRLVAENNDQTKAAA